MVCISHPPATIYPNALPSAVCFSDRDSLSPIFPECQKIHPGANPGVLHRTTDNISSTGMNFLRPESERRIPGIAAQK